MSTNSPPPGVAPFVLPPLQHPIRTFGTRSFDFSRSVALMAIINRTPDSFYDDGRTFALDAAVSAALRAVADGADWVDIGGVPFAPGPEVGIDEEVDRVVPVVAAVAARSDVVISVDTFRPEVARLSIAAGAKVINDTTGLSNPELASVVAEGGAHLVLTHSLAAPRTVYPRPHYDDVVVDVVRFLAARTDLALRHGMPAERLLIDPGHDLNKNTLHSLELTRRFAEVAALGLPALAAVSNKDFIGETLHQEKKDRLEGSLAAAVVCILGGARVVRMHNVAAAHAAVRFTEAVMGWREPAYLRHNMGDENAPAAR
ncbi:MAG: dihydropteroate synthase [Micrococcaceae bacterium]|jgi:dihydropteroate synthase|nr:dihydropteroate synthase [Micrococcaceae bacterium]